MHVLQVESAFTSSFLWYVSRCVNFFCCHPHYASCPKEICWLHLAYCAWHFHLMLAYSSRYVITKAEFEFKTMQYNLHFWFLHETLHVFSRRHCVYFVHIPDLFLSAALFPPHAFLGTGPSATKESFSELSKEGTVWGAMQSVFSKVCICFRLLKISWLQGWWAWAVDATAPSPDRLMMLDEDLNWERSEKR